MRFLSDAPHYLNTYRKALYPIYLVHFVTARCPYRCPTCFYWQEIQSAAKENELSTTDIRQIAQNHIYPWQITLTGGEPFVRADLAQIVIDYFQIAHAWRISIHTTGGFPQRTCEAIEHIFSEMPHANLALHFSLDLLDDAQDEFRGKAGAFDRNMETYHAVKALKTKFSTLKLVVDTVYSALNQDRLDEVDAYIKNKLRPDDRSLILIRGEPENPAVKTVDIKRYELWSRQWYLDTRPTAIAERIGTEMKHHISRQMKQIMTTGQLPRCCTAGDKFAVITEYGDVLPCEMLDTFTREDIVMGNLRSHQFSILNVLRSPAGTRVRKLIRDVKCACTYECAALCNTLTTPTRMAQIALRAALTPERGDV